MGQQMQDAWRLSEGALACQRDRYGVERVQALRAQRCRQPCGLEQRLNLGATGSSQQQMVSRPNSGGGQNKTDALHGAATCQYSPAF